MLSDERIRELRATELPALGELTYLDHATQGLLPASHVRAATDVLERAARGALEWGEGGGLLADVRREAARLLHAAPDELALLRSTSEGLGLLAEGLDWRSGDEVVLYERDFVGCLAPFLHLQTRGVRVTWVADRGRHRFDLDDVAAALSNRTRAVCVSVVNRSHGMRAPIEALGELCRERGIWLALDAAQAMGVLDLDAPAIGADVVSAHGYKFLCSGFGLAPTYCSPRAIEELRAPLLGWKNAELDGAGGIAVVPDREARRFEPTLSSMAGLAGMRASLRLLNDLDGPARELRAVELGTAVADGLVELGFDVLGARRPAEASTLVAARHPALDGARLVAALRERGVVLSDVDGAVRVSTHAFNTRDDVRRLLDALPGAVRSAGG